MMRVLWIKQTCSACPTQFEGEFEDGRFFYARYRWGNLTIHVGESVEDAVISRPIFEKSVGTALDGSMSKNEFFMWALAAGFIFSPYALYQLGQDVDF